MLIHVIFFISSLTVGLAITEFLKIHNSILLKIASAFTIGIVFNLLILFTIASIFGISFVSSFLTLVIILIFCLIIFLKNNFFKGIDTKEEFKPSIFLFFLFALIIVIFLKSIFVSDDVIIAGNRLVWTDWPVHISFTSSFLYGDNFPPQNPLHPVAITTYPFLADFLSAVLQSLGASLKTALVLPGIILSSIFILLLYNFGLLLFKRKNISTIALFIGLFWGGLGFLYFFGDLLNSTDFTSTLFFPPHEYTFYSEKNLWFFSFIFSELLPQRGFLLGLPMFFTSLIFLVLGISTNNKSKILMAGCLAAIMPFFHMHSYLSLLIISLSYIFLNFVDTLRTNGVKTFILNIFIYYLSPILALGLIQLPFFLEVGNQAFAPHFGWMKSNENFFIFWFKNTGLFWPLFIFALFKIRNKTAKYIFIASLPLFILPNIFRFAPWPYDNLKILTYWYLIGAFAVAWSINYFWTKNFILKILTVIIFFSLTLSGFLEIFRILNTQQTQINLWNQSDIELSKVIIEKTEPKATILAAAVHNHPITSLAGRKMVIGFPGNAWSWGFSDWQTRESEVRIALKGNVLLTPKILDKYSVDYVFIGPREKMFEPLVNEQYFTKNYKLITKRENYSLFKVK